MKNIFKKSNILHFVSILFVATFLFAFTAYAENLSVNFNYGINNVAKLGRELPVELIVENKDTQDFKGYLTLNVYENNNSVFVYRTDLNIEARSSTTYNSNISITNSLNTVIINIYNRREELITSERTNIDLSYYSDRLIIGVLSDDFNSLSYMDNQVITDTTIQTKIVNIDIEKIRKNKNCIDVADMLLISDINMSEIDDTLNNIFYSFLSDGKPIIISLGGTYGIRTALPLLNDYLYNYKKINSELADFELMSSTIVDMYDENTNVKLINVDSGIIVCTPFSFKSYGNSNDASKNFISLIEKCFDSNFYLRLSNSYNSIINNDYYNISNLLNIIDKDKLPDIFLLTILLIFYIVFLTIILYVFLRNINRREQYGKYALIFSIIYTFVMFSLGHSIMKKNTFLTYLSIVNIKASNAKEMAFLNFRTSESSDFSFDTGNEIKLSPILRNNKEPIVSLNFIDENRIKTTIFLENGNRKVVNINNARDFDSSLFVYENSNYLNDVYNVDCSFHRLDGEVTGRITNNMNIAIKDAHILLFGKVLKIGDIEPNYSVSLSRAENVGVPINNNSVIADIMTDNANQNIVKYYLDENLFGYYDYGLLFGFIDNNGTIDINSSDVGDVYGRTLLVTKITKDANQVMDDYCSLEDDVNNVIGYYDQNTNTINGESEVINQYSFDNSLNISKLYFEGIDDYDNGSIEANIPYYGEILVYNHINDSYVPVHNYSISNDVLNQYLTSDNKITVKFVPSGRDPLYRKISLPVLRAVASR